MATLSRDKRPDVPPVPEGAYVLCIRCSPRRGGNSDVLADEFSAAAREAGARVVEVAVRDLDIAGCRECHGCDSKGFCIWSDDFQLVMPHLESAAAIAWATPVFFMGTPSGAKALVDRCQCIWAKHWLLGSGKPEATRAGYLLCAAATNFGYTFDAVRRVRDAFFLVLGVRDEGEAAAGRIDAKGDAAKNANLIERAREVGRDAASKAGR